jgi:hypothetical protein
MSKKYNFLAISLINSVCALKPQQKLGSWHVNRITFMFTDYTHSYFYEKDV